MLAPAVDGFRSVKRWMTEDGSKLIVSARLTRNGPSMTLHHVFCNYVIIYIILFFVDGGIRLSKICLGSALRFENIT